jgi:CheY-like chemotaxis protein/phosphoribosyl 1,2-cyclic phosphodiesterase
MRALPSARANATRACSPEGDIWEQRRRRDPVSRRRILSVSTERPRILVVEDEPELREVFETLLCSAGYEVVLVEDGQAALEAMEKAQPDLLITDLLTPRMHGYELIRRLRATPRGVRLPILVVSGQAYEKDQKKALELGAQRFLAKPVRRQEFLAAVEDALTSVVVRFWGVRGSIAAPGPETQRYGGNTPCVTIERGRDLLILDAGTGVRKLGVCLHAEAHGKPQNLNMLITHTHWDHIQGFPFFVPAYVPGNRLDVYGPPSVEKPLDKVLRGQMDAAYFPVALGDMQADVRIHEVREPSFDAGPFKITTMLVNHPGITMGFRVEIAGVVVTYATDTEPYRFLLTDRHAPDAELAAYGGRRDQELVTFAAGADLYIADSQYSPEEYNRKRGWGHTCYEDAVAVALAGKARRVVLFSHDPMHDDEMVDAKLARCQAIAAAAGSSLEVLAAVEGSTIRLS